MPRKRQDRVTVRRLVKRGCVRWEVDCTIGGIRSRPTYESEAEARREAAALVSAIASGAIEAPGTWSEAAERWADHRQGLGAGAATCETYRRQLKAVGELLGDPDPLRLRAIDGETYRTKRAAQGRSPTTIANELNTVTSMQRWFVEQGWIREPTWADVTRPAKRRREGYLMPAEIGPFLRAAYRLAATPPKGAREADWSQWPAAVWLLMHGLCTDELRMLDVRDIDLHVGTVTVRDGKTAKRRRTFAITSQRALACLRQTFRDRGAAEPAFFTGRGARRGGPKTKWFIRRCVLTCEEAGVGRVTPHELRHTAATLAITEGSDVSAVQALLGHADVRVTTDTYSHATAVARAQGAVVSLGVFLDRQLDPPTLEVVG